MTRTLIPGLSFLNHKIIQQSIDHVTGLFQRAPLLIPGSPFVFVEQGILRV